MKKEDNRPFKIKLLAETLFEHEARFEGEQKFYMSNVLITEFYDFNQPKDYPIIHDDIDKKIDYEINHRDNSKWKIVKFLAVNLQVFQFNPHTHNSYISLPDYINNKKATINIRNDDNYCVLYTCLLKKYLIEVGSRIEHASRKTVYKFRFNDQTGEISNIIINKVEFPVVINVGNVNFPCNKDDVVKVCHGFGFTLSLFEFEYDLKKKEFIPIVIFNERE